MIGFRLAKSNFFLINIEEVPGPTRVVIMWEYEMDYKSDYLYLK
jgi:hypothetical protein